MGPNTLDKLDGILEYCQTSSSDLILPPNLEDNEKPAYYARKDLIDVKKDVEELINTAEKMIKTLEVYDEGSFFRGGYAFEELKKAVSKNKRGE